MGINHGDSVENGTYGYVLLPGSTEEETAAFAENSTVENVRNDVDVQAVKDTQSGVFAMNVWPTDGTGGESVNGIAVDASASIYTQTKDGVMTIAISDPKQKDVQIGLTLTDGYVEVLSADEGVTVNEDGSFTVDTTDSAGASFIIQVRMPADNSALQESYDAAAEKLADGNVYTADSTAALESAMAAAKEVLDNDAADQTAVDAAKETLDTAIEGLVLRADAETLAQLQAAADELRALGEKATDEQFGSAGDVLAAADEMLAKGAENISADEAKAMTADLQAAIDAVEKAIEESETGDGGEDSDTPGGDTGDGSDDGADGNAPAAVQTGDAAPIMLYVFLAAGAAVTAVLAGRFRRVR